MSEEETQVVESAETATTEDNNESYEQDDSTGEGESEAQSESGEQRTTETPEAKLARLKRQYEREAKKQGAESGTESKESTKEVNQEEKYQRLELKTEGIKGTKEQDVVLNYINESKLLGKDVSVESALKSLVVKEALADIKAKSSVPSPSKRTGTGQNDSFEYWVAQAKKGNFPRSDRAMMRRLEKARIFTT